MAAGRGSRLGNYTDQIPKCLLPLNKNGLTLLQFNILRLQEINIEKIFIVTGYESMQIEEAVKGITNIEVIYNPFWKHCNVLGSMYMALDHINDDFYFLHADTLMENGAWELFSKSLNGEMVLPYEAKKCGDEEMKIIIENGKVVKISKVFDATLASGEFVGIALFKKSTITYFKTTAEVFFKKGNLNHYMESVIQQSIDERKFNITPVDISKFKFVEVDFEEDLTKARQYFG